MIFIFYHIEYPISNFHHKQDLKNEIKRVSKHDKSRRKPLDGLPCMMDEVRKYEQKYRIQIRILTKWLDCETKIMTSCHHSWLDSLNASKIMPMLMGESHPVHLTQILCLCHIRKQVTTKNPGLFYVQILEDF